MQIFEKHLVNAKYIFTTTLAPIYEIATQKTYQFKEDKKQVGFVNLAHTCKLDIVTETLEIP